MIKIKMRSSFPSVNMKLQEKNIVPTIAEQIVVADEEFTGLSKVVVQGVTSNIDENIQAENIRKDTTILGVVGTLESIKEEQAKTITPNFSNGDITVLPDENMVISEVIIKTDEDLLANNIRQGVEVFGVTGNIVELNAEERVVAPTKEEQVILPGENKNAISKVTIGAVTSAIDENITPDNIKNGVEILGVIGTVSGAEKLTDGSYMFYNNARISQIDYLLSLLNGTITSISNMFNNCSDLTILDLSEFDATKVTTINSMFYNCRNLTTLNLPKLDTSKITNAQSLFYNCQKLTEIDVSNFDTSNFINFMNVFYGCKKLTNLDLKHFSFENCSSTSNMFYGCESLLSVDFKGVETPELTDTGNMFYGCKTLQYLDIRNFDFTKVTNKSNMFGSATYNGVPSNCEIIVADDTARDFILGIRSDFTNIKTVAEL